MRLDGFQNLFRLNATGCIILPISLFLALMVATAGVALWPKLAAPGAAIACGGGEVSYETEGRSYRPGEYIWSIGIQCRTGSGKDATQDDITLGAVALSYPVFALAAFLLLRFLLWPLALRRFRRRVTPSDLSGSPPSVWQSGPGAPVDLGQILAKVQEAVQRGEAEVRVSQHEVDLAGGGAEGGDVAARLAQLKALRDQGLINAADYEAKKAEILAGL